MRLAWRMVTAYMLCAIAMSAALNARAQAAGGKEWTASIARGEPSPKRPNQAHVWIPEGCKVLRGALIAQKTMFEERLTRDAEIRRACADKDLAVVYAECGIGLKFASEGGAANLTEILGALAAATRHPELETVPLITLGHSTAGIFARNMAYWNPARVAGVLHVMSGNLHQHLESPTNSLAGVPVLFVNGEWEQFGPEGGDIKMGLRSSMGLRTNQTAKGGERQSQTQWICMRQQLLARRGRNPENLMGLVVSRGHSHTQWEGAMSGLAAQFIRSVADLRIPAAGADASAPVKCLPARADQGWLLDADIKAPRFDPAPYAEYKGDKALALWYPDKALALKVWEYNRKGWPDADPTADWPVQKRYTPEPCLSDKVDLR